MIAKVIFNFVRKLKPKIPRFKRIYWRKKMITKSKYNMDFLPKKFTSGLKNEDI